MFLFETPLIKMINQRNCFLREAVKEASVTVLAKPQSKV